MTLSIIDWLIMLVYFVFVLGYRLLPSSATCAPPTTSSSQAAPSPPGSAASPSSPPTSEPSEVIGMGASGAKYGIITSHFYWIGAIPAMIFVGIFMMPFYYGSKARSVPEYLRLRFDEKTPRRKRLLISPS